MLIQQADLIKWNTMIGDKIKNGYEENIGYFSFQTIDILFTFAYERQCIWCTSTVLPIAKNSLRNFACYASQIDVRGWVDIPTWKMGVNPNAKRRVSSRGSKNIVSNQQFAIGRTYVKA